MVWPKIALSFFVLVGVARATDFTRFLTDGADVRVEDAENAIDGTGMPYALRARDTAGNASAVGISIFTEATGLPNLPTFPFFMKTEKGFVPATLSPKAFVLRDQPRRLEARQIAQRAGLQIVSYLFGETDTASGRPRPNGYMVLGTKAVVDVDAGEAFHDYGSATSLGLEDYLSSFPADLKSLWAEDRIDVAKHLNEFLSRMELMSPEDIEKTLGPAFEALEKRRAQKGLPSFDYRKEFQRRLSGVRAELLDFLTRSHASSRPIEFLKVTNRSLPKPHINIPTTRLDVSAPPPLSRKHAPVDLLWAHFLATDAAQSSASLAHLAKQLGTTPDEVLPVLSRLARTDQSRIYEVMPHMEPKHSKESIPQTMLNPHNRETLVVVPVNDEEAKVIESISQKAGAHVMAIRMPHGSRLDYGLTQDIKDRIRKDRLKRVIIVELPSRTLKNEEEIRATGVDLVIVDHHDYKDLDRHHRLSSLEQVADQLGWKLSPIGKAVAVMDRSLFFGLADLGVPISEIRELTKIDSSLAKHERLTKIPTNKGPLYISRTFHGPLRELVASLWETQYPAIPNVLVVKEDSINFSGSPEIVAKLSEIVRPYSQYLKEDGANWTGGDASRSMFWGLKNLPSPVMAAITRQITNYIKNELTKPIPEGEELDPRYPPVAPPPDYHPPLVIMGAPVRDLAELLTYDSADRINTLDAIRWDALDPEEKATLVYVAAKLTNPDEMAAMARIAKGAGSEKNWEPFLKRYYEIAPWARNGNDKKPSDGTKVIFGREEPPPGSAFPGEKLKNIREELAHHFKDGGARGYLHVLDKYLPQARTAWDFAALTKPLVNAYVSAPRGELDQWILVHFDDFMKLKPSAREIKRVAGNNINRLESRVTFLEAAIPFVKAAGDYHTLFKHDFGSKQEHLEKIILKQLPNFFSLKPTSREIEDLGYDVSSPSRPVFIKTMLNLAKTVEEFDTVAAARVSCRWDLTSEDPRDKILWDELPRFFAMKPSIDQQRRIFWYFQGDRRKRDYFAKLLDKAETAADFLAYSAQYRGHKWSSEDGIRSEVIHSRLKKFFSLKPTVDQVAQLAESGSVYDFVAVDIIQRGLPLAQTPEEMLRLVSLRSIVRNPELQWKLARSFRSYRRKFVKMEPSLDQKDRFDAAASKEGTEKPKWKLPKCSNTIAAIAIPAGLLTLPVAGILLLSHETDHWTGGPRLSRDEKRAYDFARDELMLYRDGAEAFAKRYGSRNDLDGFLERFRSERHALASRSDWWSMSPEFRAELLGDLVEFPPNSPDREAYLTDFDRALRWGRHEWPDDTNRNMAMQIARYRGGEPLLNRFATAYEAARKRGLSIHYASQVALDEAAREH